MADGRHLGFRFWAIILASINVFAPNLGGVEVVGVELGGVEVVGVELVLAFLAVFVYATQAFEWKPRTYAT